jgi:hypothetical protein
MNNVKTVYDEKMKKWLKRELFEFFRKASYEFDDRIQCDKISIAEVMDYVDLYLNEIRQDELVMQVKDDPVDHPSHYKGNNFEVIDIIEDFNLDFELGNCIKYILRAGKKGNSYVEDLKKAAWYLQRKIRRKMFTEVSYEGEKE